MITGEIKNKVDKIWTDIWAGGITNPLTVIEQLTYLMFIHSLDQKELETEEFENMTGEKMEKIFPQTATGQMMRWSKFKDLDPREIYDIISKRVFPAIKEFKNGKLPDFDQQGEIVETESNEAVDISKTAFSKYMSDAMFLIPTPQILEKIITGLEDLYENDIDYHAAKRLAAAVISEKAFEEISEEKVAEAISLMEHCGQVINAGLTIGCSNRRMQALLDLAEQLNNR